LCKTKNGGYDMKYVIGAEIAKTVENIVNEDISPTIGSYYINKIKKEKGA